jgi:UDP-N-acetylmuramoylalanine--D-glutamate ligase
MSSKTEKKIIIYGKGKAMQSMCDLLDYLQIAYLQMDDQDADDTEIKSAKTIIATPGIKPSHRLYTTYGKKIVSELSFLWKLIKDGHFPQRKNVTTVGITGTNGKSTTTRVLYQACQKLVSDDTTVYLGGNFDVPLSGLLLRILQENNLTQNYLIILECSSFMLRHLKDFVFDIGVLLNIAPDHIDRHGSMKDYLQAKVNILVNAKTAITNETIKTDIIKDQMRGIALLHRLWPFQLQRSPHRRLIYLSLQDFHHPWFLWEHNASNFGAVDMVLQQLYGVDYDRTILNTIEPVAHRLQPIMLNNGLTIIDDSVSSSAHALSAAIKAMTQPVVLISGWYDNAEDYKEILPLLSQHVTSAIFYGQTRAILYPLAKQVISDVIMVETLWEALQEAKRLCKKNSLTTILYSPWAKSFDQFDNVYHRIRVFEEEIEKMR